MDKEWKGGVEIKREGGEETRGRRRMGMEKKNEKEEGKAEIEGSKGKRMRGKGKWNRGREE